MKLFNNWPSKTNPESINKIEEILKKSPSKNISEANSDHLQQMTSKKVDNILTELGLLHNEANERIIKALLKYQLSLNKEEIINIKQLLNNHQTDSTEALKAIIFFKKPT